MNEKTIKFSGMNDAQRFLKKADKCDFDIDILYNHIVLDGKSIMALLSLDFTKSIIVKYKGDNDEFEKMLSNLEAV